MRQTLCYIPETCYGTPVFGWGLGIGILLVIVLFSHLYQYARHRTVNDVGNSIALLGIGTVMFVFVIPKLVEPGSGIPIRGYGFCLLIAILSALTLVVRLAKRQNISTEKVYSLGIWTVISGIIGARLFFVTEYWQNMMLDQSGQFLPLDQFLFNILNFTQGGLVVFGSILGGMLGALMFMFRNKMPVFRTFDILVPGVALGMSIGRIGCLLNGCCFGGVTDSAWSIVFPPCSPAHVHQIAHGNVFYYGLKFEEKTVDKQKMLAVAEVLPNSEAESLGLKPQMLLRNIHGKLEEQPKSWTVQTCREAAELLTSLQTVMQDETIRFDFFTNSSRTEAAPFYLAPTSSEVLPVHPTQIYSSILALLLCGTLLALGKLHFYRQRSGLVFASFMILYSIGRFMIEFVRTDEGSFFGTGLTVSQNISIVFGLTGIALFAHLCRSK